MASSKDKPIEEADEQGRAELGRQLEQRREELGYGDSRPRFWQERDVNKRLSADIENAYRANFDIKTLRRIARGYGVTYDSLVAVAYRKAEKLTPAGAAPAPPPPALGTGPGPSPITDEARAAGARPHADAIWQRLLDLAARGVTDPTGAEIFGAGTPDAKTWDDPNLRRTFTVAQMVWLLADIRRADEARAAGGNSHGTAGALVTGAVS